MKISSLPYGRGNLELDLSEFDHIDLFLPKGFNKNLRTDKNIVLDAILLGSSKISKTFFRNKRTVSIAINDPTRPIPNDLLLPPLLDWLQLNGIKEKNISFFIATGTHRNLSDEEISEILPKSIIQKYRTNVHNCDLAENMHYLGDSSARTPIYINKDYYVHDIKIVVGHIELHHFMGYSGGVKSAVIGLGGRETIQTNHKMLVHPLAKMGNFYNNPMRLDIEEIGKIIGVDLALNVVLDDSKQILAGFFGNPFTVMERGIRISQESCQVIVENDFDLVICSAGGYPKDINLYQAQKAITHACTFLKKNGTIILAAECIEGLGNEGFKSFFIGKSSPKQLISTFEKEQFSIGPHKAYQISIQTKDHKIVLISSLNAETVRKLFLLPAKNIKQGIRIASNFLPDEPKIAILPFATHIMNRIDYIDNN